MIRYIELKSGYHDDGPAWIARVAVSKSGRTLYFNGKALKRSTQSGSGNYYDVETTESYWVSGVKKKGGDRHWAGRGKITIDAGAIDEYPANYRRDGAGPLEIRRFNRDRAARRQEISRFGEPVTDTSRWFSLINPRGGAILRPARVALPRAIRFAHFRLRTSFGRRS